jgi:hypothetical protein
MKTAFASWERAKTSKKHRLEGKKGEQMSQKLDEPGNGNEGQTQTRGRDPAGDKLRITFECRQAVTGYFSETQEVKGIILDSILVVQGVHAKLSNISDDHRFIEEEQFLIAGEIVTRKAGQAAGQIMKTWVELRKAQPELFERVVVYQQPAAHYDEHNVRCPVVPGQELADSKGITSEPPGPSKPAGGQVTYI